MIVSRDWVRGRIEGRGVVLGITREGMLNLWGKTRLTRNKSHIMVTMKGRFKVEKGEKWNMLHLADMKGLGIKIRKWVGRWL